jgi:hypothetical protein
LRGCVKASEQRRFVIWLRRQNQQHANAAGFREIQRKKDNKGKKEENSAAKNASRMRSREVSVARGVSAVRGRREMK